MAKSTNQKLKLLYLMQIMLENTDDEHGLSMAEIIDKLAAYDISAERKSIYSDFELLRFYGIDIQRNKETVLCTTMLVHESWNLQNLSCL